MLWLGYGLSVVPGLICWGLNPQNDHETDDEMVSPLGGRAESEILKSLVVAL